MYFKISFDSAVSHLIVRVSTFFDRNIHFTNRILIFLIFVKRLEQKCIGAI